MSYWKKSVLRHRARTWEFSLSLWWLVLVIVFVPVLVRLGLWQLDRAAEREEAMTVLQSVMQANPVAIDNPELQSSKEPIVRVQAKGQLDWSRQLLLINIVHNTVAGYEVLVPLEFAPGQAILVSRGWLPPTPGKKPDLSPPPNTVTTQSVSGFAVIPPPRLADYQRDILEQSADYRKLSEDSSGVDWPLVIQEEEFETLSSLSGLQLIPRILQPEKDLAYAYTRIWKPTDRGPAVNYGYAAQWFGMAILLLAACIILNVRRLKSTA